MIKVIVAGSRNFQDYNFAEQQLLSYFKSHNIHSKDLLFISGGARGADKIGEQFAEKYNILLKIFPANWEVYGKSAGYIRNADMADYAGEKGILFAFWDGQSRGTKHMIDLAKRKGMNVQVIKF